MKNVGMCLDLGGEGEGYVFGDWNLERKQEFIQSILGGFGMKAKVREDGGFGGVRRMYAECCMCGATYEGHGHNAQPIYDDECCDGCNALVMYARMGVLNAEEIKEKIISHFKNQKHFIWRSLKDGMLKLKKGDHFHPIDIIRKASEKRIREEENHEKERLRRQKEREERTKKMREERERLEERAKRMREEEERLAKIEEERKARDEEDKKKREEDFERRLKALEIKEQERKEEEKREKERKAKEAEERKAKKDAEKAEKQKQFQSKRK